MHMGLEILKSRNFVCSQCSRNDKKAASSSLVEYQDPGEELYGATIPEEALLKVCAGKVVCLKYWCELYDCHDINGLLQKCRGFLQ